jgi:hypothetical protein
MLSSLKSSGLCRPAALDVARHSDTVLPAIRAAAPDRVELDVRPRVAISARFGLVTLARRSEPPVRRDQASSARPPRGYRRPLKPQSHARTVCALGERVQAG